MVKKSVTEATDKGSIVKKVPEKKKKPAEAKVPSAAPISDDPIAAELAAKAAFRQEQKMRRLKRRKELWRQRSEPQSKDEPAPWEAIPLEPKKVKEVIPGTQMASIGYLSGKLFKEMDLCEPVLESLHSQKPSYTHLTLPQLAILPALMDTRRDTLAFAKDGTGRSLAFLIALMTGIGPKPKEATKPYGIIITASSKRALHIQSELKLLTQFRHPRSVLLSDSRALDNDRDHLKRMPNIIICQPKRIVDHLKQMSSFTEFLDGAKFVVVDQLDVLLKEGHNSNIAAVLSNCHIDNKKTIMLSAVDSPEQRKFAQKYLRPDPCIIDALPVVENAVRQKTRQEYLVAKPTELPLFLLALMRDLRSKGKRRILVYCTVTEEAQYYAQLTRDVLGVEPIEIHRLAEENKTMDQIREARAMVEKQQLEEWVVFTQDSGSRWKRKSPIPGAVATDIIHIGPIVSDTRYAQRLAHPDAPEDCVAHSILLGLPMEEQYFMKLATTFSIELSAAPIPTDKLRTKVTNALQRRALAGASEEATTVAVQFWKAWFGNRKSMRQLLGCTTELLIATGNELFGVLYADPAGKAPAVRWDWASNMKLQRNGDLHCVSRGRARVDHVDLESEPEVDETEKRKTDLLALVKKLKQGAEASKKRDPDAPQPKRRRLAYARGKKDYY